MVDVKFLLHSDRIEIEVRDSGPGFDLESVQGDITSPEHIFDLRGRGIFIMRSFMDEVRFSRLAAGGMRVHLRKIGKNTMD